MRMEIASLRNELVQLEGGRSVKHGAVASPAGLENIRKVRELKFLEFTLELLTKQYEMAKIDEANDAVLIQIPDKAIAPDRKSKPKRAVIVLATALAAGFLSVLFALLRESADSARLDPLGASRLEALRKHLRWS